MSRFSSGRHAGLLVPLFSMPSAASWGIGEIADIPLAAAWLRAAGMDLLQLLPVNEMTGADCSPYSAMTAMAVDPIFISLREVEDFEALGGEAALPAGDRDRLAAVRCARAVRYHEVRDLKVTALRAAFERFEETEWQRQTERAAALRAFQQRESWWLDAYSLFRALHAREEGRAWSDWPAPLRNRETGALGAAGAELARERRYYEYLQWLADRQWSRARAACGDVGLFGDFPFMVSGDSADVWARQAEFRLDASVGTPPDAFSAEGQNWGLPVYRWDVMKAGGYEWLRQRARRSARLFDGYRVDHVVGFYRTYIRPNDGGEPYFSPRGMRAQRALGERLLGIFREPDVFIIAEDLGTVPDFVRTSLARRHVPGYKVLRWEREWKVDGEPFRDPAAYAAESVATSGTHDTPTLAGWWNEAGADERRAVAALPGLRALPADFATAPFGPAIRDTFLDALYGASSNLLLLPIQDVFGWPDQINVPGTVGGDNWTWRLPWPVERLAEEPEAVERAEFLRNLAESHHRLQG
jgi:4-alpha-glucanotransferase